MTRRDRFGEAIFRWLATRMSRAADALTYRLARYALRHYCLGGAVAKAWVADEENTNGPGYYVERQYQPPTWARVEQPAQHTGLFTRRTDDDPPRSAA